MALTVLAAPANISLVQQATVVAELGLDPTDAPSLNIVQEMIRRASSLITRECGRPFFGVGQYQETLKGSGSQLLAVSCVPLLSVSEVQEDSAVVDPTDPTSGYAIEDAEAGALYRAGGWGQAANLLAWGSDTYGSRYILPGGTSTLRYLVTYTAGYLLPDDATFPDDDPTDATSPPPLPGAIEQACLVTVRAWWYARQRDPTISQQASEEQKVTYAIGTMSDLGLPSAALGLLRDYRRVA